MLAAISVNVLVVLASIALVPEDGNVPTFAVTTASMAVQFYLLRVVMREAGRLHVEREAVYGGAEGSGQPRPGAEFSFGKAAKLVLTDPVLLVLLVILLLLVSALAAPAAWFDVPWLAVAKDATVGVSVVAWLWVFYWPDADGKPSRAKLQFGSAAERWRSRWQQFWPFGLIVVVIAGFAFGFVVMAKVLPTTRISGSGVLLLLSLWTVLFSAVFWVIIRWFEGDSRARPRPIQASARKPERSPVAGPVPVVLGLLTWDEGARSCEMSTAEQLRAQVRRLHLSTVVLPRSAEFVPQSGVPVRISLGGEQSLLVTAPVDGTPAYVVITGPEGPRTAPVVLSDAGRPVYPPSAAISMDVAIDVLGSYCATGQLPG
ncbi:Imm1 family immunity protein [Catellatospora aurea]|uniref:Imm1 family immunity protein n=1 Tax=Catellatospora aurea TaxID=1337874 RepID=A0ABW2H888_9ACTN